MVHVDVSEGDVVDYAAADGPDGRTDPAHVNSLEQHVLGGGTIIVLNGNAVVLCQNELVKTSGFAKKVCPRLRYSVTRSRNLGHTVLANSVKAARQQIGT